MTNEQRDRNLGDRFDADPVPPHGPGFWADLDRNLTASASAHHRDAGATARRGRRQWALAFAGVATVALVAVSGAVFTGGADRDGVAGIGPADDAGSSGVSPSTTVSTTATTAAVPTTIHSTTTITSAPADEVVTTTAPPCVPSADDGAGRGSTTTGSPEDDGSTTSVVEHSTTTGPPEDDGSTDDAWPCDDYGPVVDEPDHLPVGSMGFLEVSTLDGTGEYAVRILGPVGGTCQAGTLLAMWPGGATEDILRVLASVEVVKGPDGAVALVERCDDQFDRLTVGSEIIDGEATAIDPSSLVTLSLSDVPTSISALRWDDADGLLAEADFADDENVTITIDPTTGMVTRR